MKQSRGFKGVWIPAEIWLAEDLTIMEKLFFVEIDSLDNEQGCFASNGHFSDFFQLSKSRCSQIINALEKKGYITIEYTLKEGSKEIDRRVIRSRVKYTKQVVNIQKGVFNKLNPPIKFTKHPPLENAKGSNTVINNTSNNNTTNNNNKPTDDGQARFNFVTAWEKAGFGQMNGYHRETLIHWQNDFSNQEEIICQAIEAAAKENPRSPLKYVESILRNWERAGIKTASDVRAKQAERERIQKQAETPAVDAAASQYANFLNEQLQGGN